MPTHGLMSAERLVKLAHCAYQADNSAQKTDAYRQAQALVETYLLCKGPDVDLEAKRDKIIQSAEVAGNVPFIEQALAAPWAHRLAERAVKSVYKGLPDKTIPPAHAINHARGALQRKSLPFAADVAMRLRFMLGCDVHPDTFVRGYGALADAWTWKPLTARVLGDGSVAYRISAHDDAGCALLVVERVLRQGHDDGLEMFAQRTWLDARARGLNVLLDLERFEQALLRGLCTHPRTRMTRIAGAGFRALGWGAVDAAGSLMAARCGYLDAAYFNLSLAAPPANRPYTVEELIDAAKKWVSDERAMFCRRGDKPLDNRRVKALIDDLQQCEDAFELLRWEHADTVVTPPGQAPSKQLGRTFFLNYAPPWYAVRFVWGADAWEARIAGNPTGAGLRGLRLGDKQMQGALKKLIASDLAFACEFGPDAAAP